MVNWHQLLAAGESGRQRDELRRRQLDVVPGEAASIQLTSGTTGFPKAAALSHINILNNALFVGHTLGYTEADR
jgi:fatty-acyl-CoA synthase